MRLLPGLALAALGTAIAAPVGAQSASRDWRPTDRTVVGDFTRVTAIAAALDRVFIASPTALLVWRPQLEQWEGPFVPPEPGGLVGVFRGVTDPLDQSLWLARPDGWVHYRPDLDLWEQGAIPEGVQGIAFDLDAPASGAFFRTPRGWVLLPRGGFAPVPTDPPRRPGLPETVDDALRANPGLQANAARILTDPRLRRARYTAAARAPDGRGWYLGTSGVGALFLPNGALLPEPLAFGLPSTRVTALIGAPGGVWAATGRTASADAAVTWVAGGLDEFQSFPGGAAVGPPFDRIAQLAGLGDALWAATDRGVARIDPRADRVEVVDEARGLPDQRVYAVVARRGRVAAGTARGAVRIDAELTARPIAPGSAEPTYAVLLAGDSTWVGTPNGLLLALPGRAELVRPAGLTRAASLQVPVVDLTLVGDTLVALTRDNLLWRAPRSDRWTLGPTLSAVLGRTRRIAVTPRGLWVAGERGVASVRLDSPPLRPLLQGDLPGLVNDVAVEGDYLWVATDGGLVRFRLDAVAP